MTRVGMVLSLDGGWLGGINYYRNLLAALYALPERKVEAVIFAGVRSQGKDFEGFPAVKIVRSRLLDAGSIPWRIRHVIWRTFARDILFEWLFKKHGVSVFHCDWLGGDARIPVIGWIPDFQHVRLPEFFSEDEIAVRDKSFREMCQTCATIIVSSFDAQADLRKFDPVCAVKSEVLQFVAAPERVGVAQPSLEDLESRYGFSGDYFLLPNQFWKHKNHRVVIEALGLLKRQGKRVLVLATGSTVDYRHPEYFNSLMELVREHDVRESFFHLGLVPSSDLAGLMRYALAMINPSYFEGWSTTVEEAKSLGKRIILSDIPVHREQNPRRASYFLPDDANTLAEVLWETWNKVNSNKLIDAECAQSETNERRHEFAKQYQRIVLKTAGNPDKQGT